jgi:hypothetical protein
MPLESLARRCNGDKFLTLFAFQLCAVKLVSGPPSFRNEGNKMDEFTVLTILTLKKTPWSESASELHRPTYRHLSAKGLPTFADRGCHVVSVTDPHGRILSFLDRSR